MASWWKLSSSTTSPSIITNTRSASSAHAPTRKAGALAAEDEDRQNVDTDSKRIKALEDENRLLREALAKASHTIAPLSSPDTHSEANRPNTSDSQSQRIIQQLSAELKATKAYLVQPDEYATADILAMVDRLNSQIENTAANINDLYESCDKIEYGDVGDDEEFYQKQRDTVKKYLGERVYEVNTQIDETLYDHDPTTPDNPLPLQAALQNILVTWSIQVTNRFGPAGPGLSAKLAEIYDSLRTREEQAVVARWRVLTLSTLNHHSGSCIDLFLPVFLALLLVCGTRKYDATAKFVPLLQKKLVALENELLKLKSAMDCGVMSSDLELCKVDSGDVYNPSTMKDAYGDGKCQSKEQDTVLCCVGFGLRALSIEHDGPARRLASKLIQRSNVALMSLVS